MGWGEQEVCLPFVEEEGRRESASIKHQLVPSSPISSRKQLLWRLEDLGIKRKENFLLKLQVHVCSAWKVFVDSQALIDPS